MYVIVIRRQFSSNAFNDTNDGMMQIITTTIKNTWSHKKNITNMQIKCKGNLQLKHSRSYRAHLES